MSMEYIGEAMDIIREGLQKDGYTKEEAEQIAANMLYKVFMDPNNKPPSLF